jgi:hypothetical protein
MSSSDSISHTRRNNQSREAETTNPNAYQRIII